MDAKLAKDIIKAVQWTESDKEGVAYKQLAIALLTGSMRNYKEKYVPKFTEIGDLLGVPKETLHNWWQKKDEILDQKSDSLLDHLTGIAKEKVKIALTITISAILEKLKDEESIEKMSMKELLMIQKQLMQDDKILNGTGRRNNDNEDRLYLPFRSQKKLPEVKDREIIIEK
jgi:hypothetical protein